MTTSMIITTYDRAELLRYSLASIARQPVPDLEILIINDYRQDETEAVVNSFKDQLDISYHFTGHRNKDAVIWRCPGFAINYGVKRCKGDYIIISCAEIYHLDDVLHKMIASTGGLVVLYGYDDKGQVLQDLRQNITPTVDSVHEYRDNSKVTGLNTLLPFCMGMLKDDFIYIGGYDEDFTGQAYDDNDLVTRLQDLGLSYIKVDASIIHLYHSRKLATRSLERIAHNRSLFERRKGVIVRNTDKEWGLG